MFKQKCMLVFFVFVFFVISGCSSIILNTKQVTKAFEKSSLMVVLPFKNNTETPLVELRAATIVESILKTKGFNVYGVLETTKKEELQQEDINKVMENARKIGAKYIITGNINEWRYKIGMDAEPAISITIDIFDADTNLSVWNAVGSITGSGSDSIGIAAQRIVEELIRKIEN